MKLFLLIGLLWLGFPALRAQTTCSTGHFSVSPAWLPRPSRAGIADSSLTGFTDLSSTYFTNPSPAELAAFNKERLRLNKNAVIVFSSWAAANMIAGAIWQNRVEGTGEYFHKMNLAVGSINLALGAAAFWSLSKKRTDLDFESSVKEQANVEKIFLLNAGLDVAYVVGGLYTIEKSNNTTDPDKQDKYKGWGQSFLMQGGFLLFFDVTMFLVQNHHGQKLYRSLGSPRISPQSAAFSWSL